MICADTDNYINVYSTIKKERRKNGGGGDCLSGGELHLRLTLVFM